MKAITKLTFALLSAAIVVVLFLIAMTGCEKTHKPNSNVSSKHILIERESPAGSCTVTRNQLTGERQYECTSPGSETHGLSE